MKKALFKHPKDSKNPTIKEFVSMVEAHEPTWVWSYDPSERNNGERERQAIDATRIALGDEVAVGAWNRAMHKKIVPSMLHEFLWTLDKRKAKA